MSTAPDFTGRIRELIAESAIRARLDGLAREIAGAYPPGTELTVLALLNGGLIFTADLVRRLPLPTRIECLAVESYGGEKVSSGRVVFRQSLPDGLEGRHVIVLDDVLDTGATLRAVLDQLLALRLLSLKTCVLLRKKRPRTAGVDVDFVGFDITDEFVVGYGLDFQGRLRDLPYIGVLMETHPASDLDSCASSSEAISHASYTHRHGGAAP